MQKRSEVERGICASHKGFACLVEAGEWPAEPALCKLVADALQATAKELKPGILDNREISLVFTDDVRIRQLNASWRGQNKATNVLSFPVSAPAGGRGEHGLLGDIVIAQETVMREASLEKKPFEHHLTHMIVHGILHLAGFDHESDEEALEMETLERRVLHRLSIADPYAQESKRG